MSDSPRIHADANKNESYSGLDNSDAATTHVRIAQTGDELELMEDAADQPCWG